MAVREGEMEYVTEWKNRGNLLYQEGKYQSAREIYTNCIDTLTNNDIKEVKMLSQLLSNRAQTFFQERNFANALNDINKALHLDMLNEKAMLRKLVALESLERFEKALEEVDALLNKTSLLSTPMVDQLLLIRRRLRKNIQQDKKVAATESKGIEKLVHKHQQLRINFGNMLPSRITLNHSFQVSLNVGNEFGLFKRDYIPEGEKIHLVAKLRNNPQDMFYLDQEDETTCKLQNDGKKEYKFSLNERGKASFQAVIRLKKHAIPVEEDFDGISIMVCVHSDSKERWNLLSVVSLPFTVAICSKNSEKKVIEGKPSELGVHCCRAFQLEGINHEIILAESPGTLGIGGKLWDSSLVLTRYLYLHRLELIGKRVIELGSGTGLVGMFCALLGAKEVTLSDIQEVVPLLVYNIKLTFNTTAAPAIHDQKDEYPSIIGSDSVDDVVLPSTGPNRMVGVSPPKAVEHLWGTSTACFSSRPNVIVLSDVVYDPEGYEPLISSLKNLAIDRKTQIFMAHRSRNPMEHLFFSQLECIFEIEQKNWAKELGQEDKEKTSPLSDIKIFIMRRKV